MPEVTNFSLGQFNSLFAGETSAADLLAKAAGTVPAGDTTKTTTPEIKKEFIVESAEELLKKAQETKPTEKEETEEEKKTREEAELAKPTKTKAGRPAEVKLDETTKSVITQLIDEGKLLGFEDGKIETKADLAELLELNKKASSQEKDEEIYQRVYNSLSPAAQFLMNYAQKAQSPQDLLPLLTSTSNIEKVEALDETKPTDQEKIVRLRMKLSGDDDETIDSEIQDLKDRAKLEDKAKLYKPVISQHYQRETQKILATQQEEERQMMATFESNRAGILSVLQAQNIDGLEFKKDDKALVYEMLAVPREQYGGGVGIYKAIDDLFIKGDFNTLSQVGLLLADKKKFDSAYSTKVRMTNADQIARKLQTASRTGGAIQEEEEPAEQKKTVQRESGRNGFGFSR